MNERLIGYLFADADAGAGSDMGIKSKVVGRLGACEEDDEMVADGRVDDIRRELDLMSGEVGRGKEADEALIKKATSKKVTTLSKETGRNGVADIVTVTKEKTKGMESKALDRPQTNNEPYKLIRKNSCIRFEQENINLPVSRCMQKMEKERKEEDKTFPGVYRVLSLKGQGDTTKATICLINNPGCAQTVNLADIYEVDERGHEVQNDYTSAEKRKLIPSFGDAFLNN